MQHNGMDAGDQQRPPANPAAAAATAAAAAAAPNRARLQRRRRLHELVLALIAQQGDLELLDGEALLSGTGGGTGQLSNREPARRDPASWLEHNRRLIQRYQALVRTAATLDALIDQEVGDGRGT